MARFLIRRILQGLLVLWLMTVGVFLIFFVGPGPKAVPRALAGRNATPQTVAAVTKRLRWTGPTATVLDSAMRPRRSSAASCCGSPNGAPGPPVPGPGPPEPGPDLPVPEPPETKVVLAR